MTSGVTEPAIFSIMSGGAESIDEIEAGLNLGTQNATDLFNLYNP